MKTLIIGAGAIGSLVGAKLAQGGSAVSLVGRRRFVDAVASHGLQIYDEVDERTVADIMAFEHVSDAWQASPDGFDAVILAIKSYDTADALAGLVPVLTRASGSTPLVVSLQNGVGNEELIAQSVGDERVVAGVITTPVTVLSPARVRVDKPKYRIGISGWDPEQPATTRATLRRALIAGGFTVTEYADARSMKWTKLLMNMVGNASSAILDQPPEISFQDPGVVDLEIEAWREALAVMDALHIEPVDLNSYPFAKLAPWIRRTPKPIMRPILRKQVAGARGGKMPSLHIDLYGNKGKNEISWLNGAVATHGRTVDVSTPVNSAFTETVTALVHSPEKRPLWQHNALRLIVKVEEVRERQ